MTYSVTPVMHPAQLTALAAMACRGEDLSAKEQELERYGALERLETDFDVASINLRSLDPEQTAESGAGLDSWLLTEIYGQVKISADDPIAADGGFWTWLSYRFPDIAMRRWGEDVYQRAERPGESRSHVRSDRKMSLNALSRHTFAYSWWAGHTLMQGCDDDQELFDDLAPIVARASFRRNLFEREVGIYPPLVAAAAIIVHEHRVPIDGDLDLRIQWIGERNGTSLMECMTREQLVDALLERTPLAA